MVRPRHPVRRVGVNRTLAQVNKHLTTETRVVIGHSLGSVVAYDTLRTRRWVNIAAPDDVVAARRELHAIFDRDRPHDALFEDTRNVDNGSKPHQINFYLTKKSCGAAVADTLT